MSSDKSVTKGLIATLEDGKAGFAKAAEKVSDTDSPEMSKLFRELSKQREQFGAELSTLAASYGDDIDEDGSATGTIHRGWMAIKDMLAGSSPSGVLDAAAQGEEHAVKQFEEALTEDISPELRAVILRQFTEVKAAQVRVQALQKTNS